MRHSIRTLLLSFGLASALSVSLLVATPVSAATTLERAFVTKLNASRVYHGLRALYFAPDLTTRAHRHSAAMASRRRLYHSNLSLVCCYRAVAENVAVGYTVTGVHRALMNSSAHRANILDRRWTGVGVGVVQSGGRIWVTQIFRQPS
jgi:uncharacterized protein YkwD